jgi:hypothetical protein
MLVAGQPPADGHRRIASVAVSRGSIVPLEIPPKPLASEMGERGERGERGDGFRECP